MNPLLSPNPWNIGNGQYGESIFSKRGRNLAKEYEPRTRMELVLYQILPRLVEKKGLREKSLNQKIVQAWIKEIIPLCEKWLKEALVIADARSKDRVVVQPEVVALVARRCLLWCLSVAGSIQRIAKDEFFFSGVPDVWVKVMPPQRLPVSRLLTLCQTLKKGARIHPGSKNQMWDWIHPSWHAQPLHKHKKRSRRRKQTTETNPRWGWVASNWDVKSERLISPIQNLYPDENKELYHLIERVIASAIPAWYKCLGRKQESPFGAPAGAAAGPVTRHGSAWFCPDTLYNQLTDFFQGDQKKDAAFLQQHHSLPLPKLASTFPETEWCEYKHHVLVAKATAEADEASEEISDETLDELGNGFPSDKSSESDQEEPKWTPPTQMQLYVKIAHIQLTPENPSYELGNWHVEGIEEEHVAATAIYYFDMANVTESYLEFRAPVTEPPYEQNDRLGTNFLFDTDTLVQTFGRVATKPHHMVVFPNLLHHRVLPFTLRDKTKPGHRTFLVLWLVDPSCRVVSTGDEGHDLPRVWIQKTLLSLLPSSLGGMVSEYASMWDETILQQSVQELNQDRSHKTMRLLDMTQSRDFDLCEH